VKIRGRFMNIEWATLCTRAENTPSGFNIQGANLELAVVPELPGQFAGVIRPGNCRDFSSWKRMEHDKEFIAEAIPR
jgi:hypothetical protein